MWFFVIAAILDFITWFVFRPSENRLMGARVGFDFFCWANLLRRCLSRDELVNSSGLERRYGYTNWCLRSLVPPLRCHFADSSNCYS